MPSVSGHGRTLFWHSESIRLLLARAFRAYAPRPQGNGVSEPHGDGPRRAYTSLELSRYVAVHGLLGAKGMRLVRTNEGEMTMKNTTAVKDPVCGMDIETATAAGRSEHKGQLLLRLQVQGEV
jgi:hypothetical protein